MPPTPTKAELLETLEAERWRTLGVALDRLENQSKSLEKTSAGESADLRREIQETRATLARLEAGLSQSGIVRIFRMLEKGGWRERISLLSPILAAIFFGYCLAASIPPGEAARDLLQTAKICTIGASTPSAPAQEADPHAP